MFVLFCCFLSLLFVLLLLPSQLLCLFLLLLISCYCETIFQKHSKRNAHNTLSLETTTIGNKQHLISQKFFDGFFLYIKHFFFFFLFLLFERKMHLPIIPKIYCCCFGDHFVFFSFFYPILWSNDVFYTVFYPLYTFPTTLYLWSQIFYYVLLNG